MKIFLLTNNINNVNFMIRKFNSEKNRCLSIRLNREFGISRSGPATVSKSEVTMMSLQQELLWEGVISDDSKPGELPNE